MRVRQSAPQPFLQSPSVKDVEEIREILNFQNLSDIDGVLAKLNSKLREDGLNMAKEIVFDVRNFCKIMHFLYP